MRLNQRMEKKQRFPVALGVGVVILAISLTGMLTGGLEGGGVLFLLVGVALTCTGLIQRSVESKGRERP